MKTLADLFTGSQSVKEYTDNYFGRLQLLLAALDRNVIADIINRMEIASRNGNVMYFIANGGSAAAASHIVNDFVVGSYIDTEPPFRAFCLSDNVPSLTAISNDFGFEHSFTRQLKVHLQPGDIVVAMSVSGNSPNIVQAIEYARQADAVTIGMCGFDGGQLAKEAEIVLHAPSAKDEYGPIEDFFAIMVHIFTTYLAMSRGKRLAH